MNPEFEIIHRPENAATRLAKLKGEIISVWESRSRGCVSATQGKDSLTVQNELTKFIDALVRDLSPDFPAQVEQEKEIAVLHAQQRSGLTKYTLPQVLKEYAVLREVLIEVLRRHGHLTEEERKIIHAAVDAAIEIAGNEFANAEKASLKLALTRAEQSNRDLDQFAAIIAHDLRSPLATISGFTDLMEDECSAVSDITRDAMTRVKTTVRSLISFIDVVLGYARLSANTPVLEIIDASDAVQAAIRLLKCQITAVGGTIHHESLPKVKANIPLLTQVFQNLFTNSLKFLADRTPDICVKVEDEGVFWRFSVTDNGTGFDPEFKDAIFDFHKRLDSKNTEGAGIGLASCKRVIEIHGGSIWAESTPGRGSTFFFTLPK
jgi:signal transduction histidine kinase